MTYTIAQVRHYSRAAAREEAADRADALLDRVLTNPNQTKENRRRLGAMVAKLYKLADKE